MDDAGDDSCVDIKHHGLTVSKPHSTPLTLKWLEDNYETSEGVCIPRSTLYLHYLEFCHDKGSNPVNAASFGKIIRQQFPQITTRRLGTRGQSKYHYYGIAVRETSQYYDVIYSAKGAQSTGEGKKENTKQMVAYSPRSKLGTLLPPFPDVLDLKIPEGLDQNKVMTFVMMYRTHCQRILDTVIRANFDEVESFLHHFWQGMPRHITPILDTPLLSTMIALCDGILYKALCGVLVPSVTQSLPESLTQVIGQFADRMDGWVEQAMNGMGYALRHIKLQLSRQFSQTLRRQLSVNHLIQATSSVLHSQDTLTQMLADWMTLDLGSIAQQALYTNGTEKENEESEYTLIWNICQGVEKLLDSQSPIESYIDWLEELVDTWVTQTCSQTKESVQNVSRRFLLLWTCLSSQVIRDMTIQSATSFGSFHLVQLMLDEFVLYKIQSLNADHRQLEFLRILKGETTSEELKPEVILPDTTQVTLPLRPFISSPSHKQLFCHGDFPESLFDYESSSEIYDSGDCDDDFDDDDDDDDDDDVDDCFIPSPPFEVLKDFSSPFRQSHPSFLNPMGQQHHPHHPHHPNHNHNQLQHQPHESAAPGPDNVTCDGNVTSCGGLKTMEPCPSQTAQSQHHQQLPPCQHRHQQQHPPPPHPSRPDQEPHHPHHHHHFGKLHEPPRQGSNNLRHDSGPHCLASGSRPMSSNQLLPPDMATTNHCVSFQQAPPSCHQNIMTTDNPSSFRYPPIRHAHENFYLSQGLQTVPPVPNLHQGRVLDSSSTSTPFHSIGSFG